MANSNLLELRELSATMNGRAAVLNEWLATLEAGAGHWPMIDIRQNTPPGSPAEGDVYGTGASPTGVWAGQPNSVAIYYNGDWIFSPLREGLTAYDQTVNVHKVWSGAGWVHSSEAGARVSVRNFGAVGAATAGAATTDYKAAIDTALATGLPLTGDGLWYAVTGNIALPDGASLWDIKLKQLAPGASRSVITLSSTSVNNISLIRAVVDRNGDGTNNGANASNLPNVSLGLAFGIKISGGTGHHIEDIEVYGDDSGTLIGIFDLDYTSKVIRPYAHDCLTVVAGPTDDMACGMTFQGNDRLVVDSPRVARIGWKATVGAADPVAEAEGAWLYSRGIATTGNTALRMLAPTTEDTWQGIDNSGDVNDGNTDCQIVYGYVKNAATWGYKWANLQRRGLMSHCTAELCGYGGFTCNSDFEIVDFDAQTVNFAVGNVVTGATSGASGTVSRVYDTGAAGWISLTNWNSISFTDNENLQVSAATRAVANIPASLVSLAITDDDANVIEDCIALDCGTAGGTRGGFIKLDGIRNYSVPLKIRRSKAIDRRATPVMPYGFYAETPPNQYGWCEAIDCRSTGATDTAFRGVVVQNSLWTTVRLVAGRTLTSTTADQAIFSSTRDEITLEHGSIYEFSHVIFLSAMAASGNFSWSLGGTAVVTGKYSCDAAKIAAISPSTPHTAEKTTSDVFTARALVTASANTQGYAIISGEIKTGATGGGTIIPQIALGTAAAADALNGTWFKIRKIATNSGNNSDNVLAGAVL